MNRQATKPLKVQSASNYLTMAVSVRQPFLSLKCYFQEICPLRESRIYVIVPIYYIRLQD
jgi:hypothetical protein